MHHHHRHAGGSQRCGEEACFEFSLLALLPREDCGRAVVGREG